MRSIDVATDPGQMVKPKELISIRGAGPLTLTDRRTFNVLLDHAWGKDILSPHHGLVNRGLDQLRHLGAFAVLLHHQNVALHGR